MVIKLTTTSFMTLEQGKMCSNGLRNPLRNRLRQYSMRLNGESRCVTETRAYDLAIRVRSCGGEEQYLLGKSLQFDHLLPQ